MANYRFVLFLLSALLLAAAAGASAQKRPASAKPKPAGAARFVVHAQYEETYIVTTNSGSEIVNHNAVVKVDIEASRWVLISKNEVGNVEFLDLPGGQPATAGGNVSFTAIFDGKSGIGTNSPSSIHATKNFGGPLTPEQVSLSIPQLTELGDGLAFNLELHNVLKGKCSLVTQPDGITRSDCSDPAGGVSGLDTYGENGAGKTPETPMSVNYSLRFELLPELHDIARLKAKGELNSTDPFAVQRQMRLDEAYAQKNDPFSSRRWFGAATVGNPQAGYKITFTGTKEHPTNNGEQKLTQKLTVTADIIPGGTR
jgi:hypothetical protein